MGLAATYCQRSEPALASGSLSWLAISRPSRKPYSRRLLQRGEIPIRLKFVGRLMVVVGCCTPATSAARTPRACRRTRWRAPMENAGMPACAKEKWSERK